MAQHSTHPSVVNAYRFAIGASWFKMVASFTCVKLFLDELHLSPQDEVATLSDFGLDKSWCPFDSFLTAYRALVWMIILVNFLRGLLTVMELVGSIMRWLDFLLSFRTLSRAIQVGEIIFLLLFIFVWSVPTNVGLMQSKLVAEVILIGVEMVLRESVLAYLTMKTLEMRRRDAAEAAPAPRKEGEPSFTASQELSRERDLPPPYSHVVVTLGASPVERRDQPEQLPCAEEHQEPPPAYSIDLETSNCQPARSV